MPIGKGFLRKQNKSSKEKKKSLTESVDDLLGKLPEEC